MKYQILINILDKIRNEATKKYQTKYNPSISEIEKINNARGLAYIHLYLKVFFGLLQFDERERFITDGSYDGGIDGYYIDEERKIIYLIQSKFRTNKENFEKKEIQLEEILIMDVDRILKGEEFDEKGNQYNGKIKQLQREVSNLSDIARFSYQIILLANLCDVSPVNLRKLTGGYSVEVFNFEKSYEKLVFPVISGTYFTAGDISIPIDLSNKNAGSKISYTVKTKVSDCEITVLFVPTFEIAKIMNKYKNSILKYNPRSYLDLEGQYVNNAIRETILKTDTNEFALFNNGITLLSDETFINEKIGQKNKAQLIVKNPQIINGGQTSFTLSRIYDEHKTNNPEKIFHEKEVLLKIITLLDDKNQSDKLRLIDEVSNATNKQTPVINADKYANEVLHQEIQKIVFNRYGMLYERKRGEFSDGLKDGYVEKNLILERNLFLRLYYSANGIISKGSQKKLFQKNNINDIDLQNYLSFDKFYLAYHVFNHLSNNNITPQKFDRIMAAKVFIFNNMFFTGDMQNNIQNIENNIAVLNNKWHDFIYKKMDSSPNGKRIIIDRVTGEKRIVFHERKYIDSISFEKDVIEYFKN